ncbi:SIR2 family NAD-dependent protein deacylase [Bremerella cremea]|uniref:SIR2 family NAD-dependent protein deacylase n=1 Tax=Bremerella cremea TaxID=1031537 RepID=UPI001314FF61|nr:Sir2 family NAD-dependent protein deacetylase [Bremerella cremea]
MSSDLQLVSLWLRKAKSAVVFTGAGISTESGIPDFRSPGGVWTKYRTVYFDEFCRSAEARHEYWSQKSEAHTEFAAAVPNVGHHTIAQWEASGLIRGVITQNIDGLHQIAGSQDVLELHGTAREVSCLDCDARFPVAPFVEQFRTTNQVPLCPKCGDGRLKHATVSFGQSLPEKVFERAHHWCQEADLVISVGSSLVVYPAAGLPELAKRNRAKLVIINRDETGLDSMADMLVDGSCGEALAAIHAAL